MTGFLVPDAVGAITPAPVPTFSVIIACYQAAGTVGAAIRSCLDQTVRPLEIIVVDDGSTDDLDAALAPFVGDIVLLRQANGGESVAKNAGVAAARGDYVVILDADDVAYPNRVQALGALAAARPDLAILTHDADLTRDGELIRRYFGPHNPFPTTDQRAEILRRCFVVNPAVRRADWIAAGGYDPTIRIGADWECWIRMILAGARVGCIDEPLSEYRQTGEQLTADRLAGFRGRLDLLRRTLIRDDLTPRERGVLEHAIAALEVRAAREAVRLRTSDARALTWRVVVGRHHALGTRLRALGSTVAPAALVGRVQPA